MFKRARTDDSQATIGYTQSSTSSRRSRMSRRLSRRGTKLRGPTPYGFKYPFERVVDYDVPLNLSTGWAPGGTSNGLGLGFSFTLDNLQVEFGNGSTTDIAINGSSDFTSLFDQWRIERVDMLMYYTGQNHTVQPSTINTYAMPIFRVVTDLDNSDVSATEILEEYPQCRTWQTGMSRAMKHTVYYPGVQTTAQLDTAADVPAIVKRAPWIDCATAGIAHHGIKVKYVPFNTNPDYSPDIIMGACKFSFKIYYTLKCGR